MVKIAIASGKGGTGKSTVALNLAHLLSGIYDDVALLDCDVEEPNCHIFLNPQVEKIEKIFLEVPVIDNEKCVACGKCLEICQFNCLALIKNKIINFSELCHSCGGCELVCPSGAIGKGKREIGNVIHGKTQKMKLIYGELRIGEAMSPPLIKEVKKNCTHQIQILDCPPGTSCPLVSSIDEVDYVIMVAEPTPFGLYDLTLSVDVMKKLGVDFGIVINKSGKNDYLIENLAKKEGLEILTRIDNDRQIAELYSKGKLIVNELPKYKKKFNPLLQIIKGLMQ